MHERNRQHVAFHTEGKGGSTDSEAPAAERAGRPDAVKDIARLNISRSPVERETLATKLELIAKSGMRRMAIAMTGTARNPFDVLLVEMRDYGKTATHKILGFKSFAFPKPIAKLLKQIDETGMIPADDFTYYRFVLGQVVGEAINIAIAEHGYANSDFSLVGYPQQTVRHCPKEREFTPEALGVESWLKNPIRTRGTLAMGEQDAIRMTTGIITVGSPRTRDMATGGQGAPLIPYFDFAMFVHRLLCRVIHNGGGIWNFTLLPAGATQDQVIAFDAGGANGPINTVVEAIFQREYDANGELAAAGSTNPELLRLMIEGFMPFIVQAPPKSTDRYLLRQQEGLVLDWYRKGLISGHDAVSTVTDFVIQTTVMALERHVFPRAKPDEHFGSGGIMENPTVLGRMREKYGIHIRRVDELGIASEQKECLGFAYIINDSLGGLPTNIIGATGGKPVPMGLYSI